MTDRSKAFEITVTALGVIVTAILGYGQYNLGVEQAAATSRQVVEESRRAADSVEVQVMSLVAPHFSNLAKPGPDFPAAERIVVAAAEYLSNKHGRTALAAMAAKISEGNSAASSQNTARLQEAAVTAPADAKWYAVLATLPPDNEISAKQQADSWLVRVSAKGLGNRVDLYRTKISNSYAIVVGGPVAQSDAVDLARQARDLGVVSDAFAQRDREWKLVGTAPFKK